MNASQSQLHACALTLEWVAGVQSGEDGFQLCSMAFKNSLWQSVASEREWLILELGPGTELPCSLTAEMQPN